MRFERFVAQLIIRCGLLGVFEHLEARRTNILRILSYHRIGGPETETGQLNPSLLNANPKMFSQQMRFLDEYYHPLSVNELLFYVETNRPLPPRSVMITFDDGYRDFLDTAWPILLTMKIPAVLFVATGFLSDEGRLFWWDQLFQAISKTELKELSLPPIGSWPLYTRDQRHAALNILETHIRSMHHFDAMKLMDKIVKALEVKLEPNGALLNWNDVRRLSDAGLAIGAHTRSHPILTRINRETAREEIVGSQQDLQMKLRQTWPIFAYPCGGRSDICPDLASILNEAGIKMAMTTIEGHNKINRTHPLFLRRVGMASNLSLAEFRLVLTGLYNIYGVIKNGR